MPENTPDTAGNFQKGLAFYTPSRYYINEVELSGAKMMKMERGERDVR